MRYLLVILLFTGIVSAQYSKNDYELVKTTFTKEFSPEIINKYISSDNKENVIAGLLSLANSKDTSFVEQIVKLDEKIYGKYIAFALGEIGSSHTSLAYLSNYIFGEKKAEHISDFLEAYGKIGSTEDYILLQEHLKNNSALFHGYAYALYNFNQRGVIKNYLELSKILANDLSVENEQLLFDALFGLQRIKIDEAPAIKLKDLITKEDKHLSVRCLSYALSALRRANVSPLTFDIFNYLLSHPDWRVRCEAVRNYAQFPFANKQEIDTYIALLSDKNNNVARQAAISLKEIKLDEELKSYLHGKTAKLLSEEMLGKAAEGELFISYLAHFPAEIKSMINEFDGKIDDQYLFAVAGENVDVNWAFDFLNSKFEKVNLANKMNLMAALATYQSILNNDKSFNKAVLDQLRSDEGTMVSFMCFALDSLYWNTHLYEIENIAEKQTEQNLNNGFFAEALTSLYTQLKNYDPNFASGLLNEFSKSTSDDLVRFYENEKGETIIKKSLSNFDELWKYAFLYKAAKIITEKGNFIITFNPEIAPISVGNFCSLTDKKYFDDIIFHRVVPDFVAQAGDPTGTGWGGPGYTINSEFSPTQVEESLVGMASSGTDTEGSQWFVMHNDFPHLYGRYTMFGRMTDGMSDLANIDQGTQIINIELIK